MGEVLCFVESGNGVYAAVAEGLLRKLCRPLHARLVSWMCDGVLDDPHDEFFVSENSGVTDDDFWGRRFTIRPSMLPYSEHLTLGVTPEIALKILSTGKAIIFLRQICKERGEEMKALEKNRQLLLDMSVEWLYDFRHFHKFVALVDSCHLSVNQYVIQALLSHHQLKMHLQALNKFLMLTQGDFCTTFLDQLDQEFEAYESAMDLEDWEEGFAGSIQYRLSELLTSAIEQSNAAYEPAEVKRRLDVRPLTIDDEAEGFWGAVSLRYVTDGPISTLLTEEVVTRYCRLYDCFWRVKRLDYVMSRVCAKLIHNSRLIVAEIPETATIFHKFQLVAAEMRSLEICLLSYFSEVTGSAWSSLEKKMDTAKDLDSLIDIHDRYLDDCLKGCLLDADSEELQTHLRRLWGINLQLVALHKKLETDCQTEMEARREHRERMKANTRRGQWADVSVEHYEEGRRLAVNGLTQQIHAVSQKHEQYRNSLVQLLLILCNQKSEHLRNLTLVLDFNGFYEQLERRLAESRTHSRVTQIFKRV